MFNANAFAQARVAATLPAIVVTEASMLDWYAADAEFFACTYASEDIVTDAQISAWANEQSMFGTNSWLDELADIDPSDDIPF